MQVYQQKIKHVLYEQQSDTADTKIAADEQLGLEQSEQREKERDIRLEIRKMKVRQNEMAVVHYDLIKNLKQVILQSIVCSSHIRIGKETRLFTV